MTATLIVRRLIGAAITFLVSTVVVFTLAFALPGDPALAIAGRRQVPATTLAAIRDRYALDEPLAVQYLQWLGRLLRGDLGESFVHRRGVTAMLLDAAPVTLTLVGLTIVIEIGLGVFIGTVVATRRGGALDAGVLAACTAALATPLFVVAVLAQEWFGVRWRLLPVAGTQDGLRSYILPALTLALAGTAVAIRLMRTEASGHLHAQHVRLARAKGLREGAVTRRHVVRNALLTVVTFTGLEIGALAGGSVVVERVFNLPGVGRALADAIRQHDNALIVGFSMAVIAVYLIVDLVVDLVALGLDPRLKDQIT